jgi:hypothetical protein
LYAVDEKRLDTAAILALSAALPEHVVYRTFVYETVVLNLQSGKYHGLNRTGGRMLEVLESSETVKAAAAELATEFAQPLEKIEKDLGAFCRDLAERGLITLNG